MENPKNLSQDRPLLQIAQPGDALPPGLTAADIKNAALNEALRNVRAFMTGIEKPETRLALLGLAMAVELREVLQSANANSRGRRKTIINAALKDLEARFNRYALAPDLEPLNEN